MWNSCARHFAGSAFLPRRQGGVLGAPSLRATACDVLRQKGRTAAVEAEDTLLLHSSAGRAGYRPHGQTSRKTRHTRRMAARFVEEQIAVPSVSRNEQGGRRQPHSSCWIYSRRWNSSSCTDSSGEFLRCLFEFVRWWRSLSPLSLQRPDASMAKLLLVMFQRLTRAFLTRFSVSSRPVLFSLGAESGCLFFRHFVSYRCFAGKQTLSLP